MGKPEAVNHPANCQGAGIEAIEETEGFQLNFRLGTVKYVPAGWTKGKPS